MNDREINFGLAHLELATGETLSDERRALYIERLSDLKNDLAWATCIKDLEVSCLHFPKLPEIREAYRAAVARQPQRDALEEHKPTPEERKETAAMLRAWMAETFGDKPIIGDMNSKSRVGPGGHRWGDRREIRPMEYEPRELPGGGIPERKRPFGERD